MISSHLLPILRWLLGPKTKPIVRTTPEGRDECTSLPQHHKLYYALRKDHSWINRRIDELQIVSADSTDARSIFVLNSNHLIIIVCQHIV